MRLCQVKCVFRILTFRNVGGPEAGEPTEGRKPWCAIRICLIPWEWDREVVCYRAGNKTVGLDLEERRESEYSLPVSLAGMLGRSLWNACRQWQLR